MQRGPHEQVGDWVSDSDGHGAAAGGTSPLDPSWGFSILDQVEMYAALPEMEFIVDKILPVGAVGILAGRAGSMKSMMALDMAIAVATGGTFLGEFKCKHRYVLYLNYENPKLPFLWRLQRLTWGRGHASAPVMIGHFPRAYLHEDGFRNCLRAMLAGPTPPGLVIVDTLRAALPGVDENDSCVRAHLDEVRRVAEGTGTSFLFLHHAGKGNSPDALLRGSSALRDAVDVALVVAPTDAHRTIRLKHDKTRDHEEIKPIDVRLEIQPTGAWRLETVDPKRDAARARSALIAAVLTFLEDHRSSTSTAVAKGVKRRREDVDKALKHLVSVGVIEKASAGRGHRYAIVE